MTSGGWSYPGARWWKFDFHTHTPASTDTHAWQAAIGTPQAVTPETWLRKFMEAGIDCVCVTDHNSGAWIDPLKEAYACMAGDSRCAGFRELALFPGVEISVCGGFHLLAIFGPTATTRTISDLLARVGYQGTEGDSDGVTRDGPEDVVAAIVEAGGIPIPAHADRSGEAKKALLAVRSGGSGTVLDANTVRQVMTNPQILAVEWETMTSPVPEIVRDRVAACARVLGSDCHSFQGPQVPGSRFTWVKMESPTLEGLSLALLDGNGASIRRSDDEDGFDPERLPSHVISSVTVEQARYMGRRQPQEIKLSPFFNAIVGGRGTGKSTLVHALRLASGRAPELQDGSEAGRQLVSFRRVAKNRSGEGGLRENTVIRIEWQYEGRKLRLNWTPSGDSTSVEEWLDGQWKPSSSQAVNDERFPVRIFSQGQIAGLAGSGRRQLLAIIDDAARVAPRRAAFEEARRAFLEQCARLRSFDGKLQELPELTRKLAEVVAKLEMLDQGDHADVLRAYARANSQHREIKETFEQAREVAGRLEALATAVKLDDWSQQHFGDEDRGILAWRRDVDASIAELRARLTAEAAALRQTVDGWNADARVKDWRAGSQVAQRGYDELQGRLQAQGVADPGAFQRLTGERQSLDQRRRDLLRLQADRQQLLTEIEQQRALLSERRLAITEARRDFITTHLHDNPHVRITIDPLGSDPRQIERELRELLDIQDERFSDDVLRLENDVPPSGVAFELADSDDKSTTLDQVRSRLVERTGIGRHFQNYLKKRFEKPELRDHILAWFPEDDLRIEYQRAGRWTPIDQGSQGQRSAAILAFLLAFGDEPIVLDQPEDDLDNHLIYNLIVRQLRENKQRRQLVIVTHNPNIVVNGDAELVHVMDFGNGQCFLLRSGALQDGAVRREVCEVMEGGREAFAKRWKRLGGEG